MRDSCLIGLKKFKSSRMPILYFDLRKSLFNKIMKELFLLVEMEDLHQNLRKKINLSVLSE